MNKSELISAVAQASGVQKKDAERVMNAALDNITAALARGEKVQLSGFGTFETKQRQGRVGRNITTRESVKIPAKTVATFKPSQYLKEKVDK